MLSKIEDMKERVTKLENRKNQSELDLEKTNNSILRQKILELEKEKQYYMEMTKLNVGNILQELESVKSKNNDLEKRMLDLEKQSVHYGKYVRKLNKPKLIRYCQKKLGIIDLVDLSSAIDILVYKEYNHQAAKIILSKASRYTDYQPCNKDKIYTMNERV